MKTSPQLRVAAKAVIESGSAILALHPSKIDLNRKWHMPGRPPIWLSHEHDGFAWLDIINYRQFDANPEVYEIVELLLANTKNDRARLI